MTESATTCFMCGGDEGPMIAGARGSICSGCIWSLGARLAEEDPEPKDPNPPDDFSAHDYQSRIDLASAYAELGRPGAAATELILALEAALLCGDHEAAVNAAARAMAIANGPTLRDKLCAVIARLGGDAPPG